MSRLSILICHLPARAAMLKSLLASLDAQRESTAGVELLVDNRVGISTGAKRNDLLRRATGTHVAFVDDDDRVSSDYLSRIAAALESDPDVVGMELQMIVNGGQSFRCIHSMIYDRWFDQRGDDGAPVYFRCPNHLNPVRRTLALRAGFPDVTVGEDKAYSLALHPLLKSEVMLHGYPVYLYRAGPRRDYLSQPPAIFA